LATLTTSGACVGGLFGGHKDVNGNAHRSHQVLLFFMFMWQPLYVLLQITMKSNIRPHEIHTFMEWTVLRSLTYSTSKPWDVLMSPLHI